MTEMRPAFHSVVAHRRKKMSVETDGKKDKDNVELMNEPKST